MRLHPILFYRVLVSPTILFLFAQQIVKRKPSQTNALAQLWKVHGEQASSLPYQTFIRFVTSCKPKPIDPQHNYISQSTHSHLVWNCEGVPLSSLILRKPVANC